MAAVVAVASQLAASADRLNELDGIAGDGDLGITVSAAVAALATVEPAVAPLEVGPGVRRIGTELAKAVPSTGGTLIAFSFMAAGKALTELEAETPGAPAARQAATALTAAAASLALRGKVAPGDKTMLDALEPAARAATEAADAGLGLAEVLARAADTAEAGAAATASMRATVGRAGWLADRSQGHPDAGATLIAMALRAAANLEAN
jgi:dihydroxyacetone kinase